jgi:HAD superfamily hydrolase (TIGR01493 family)
MTRQISGRKFQGVLFDCGDTLFTRDGTGALVSIAGQHGVALSRSKAAELWNRIVEVARTPEELAKGRDISPDRHREAWIEIYSQADQILAGFGTILYDDFELNPASWIPFPDTISSLRSLHGHGIPVGVVSDAGWDIRRIFEVHGLSELISAFVLSFEYGVTKPNPSLFKTACSLLGAEPRHVLMVGDHFMTDGGATAAGLTAYILPPSRLGAPRGLSSILQLFGVPEDE